MIIRMKKAIQNEISKRENIKYCHEWLADVVFLYTDNLIRHIEKKCIQFWCFGQFPQGPFI